MDIETLLRKAEQNGCMVVLNDIAPNRERSELVFRVPESVYDTPVAALDIDESIKNALQKQKITVLENLLHRLAMGKNAAKQLHIAQDAAEQVVNAVIETAYRSLSEPEKRNFWERFCTIRTVMRCEKPIPLSLSCTTNAAGAKRYRAWLLAQPPKVNF